MNILEASNKLFVWYSTNTSFNIKRDFTKLVPISLDVEDDKASLSLALSEFIDNKLVREKNGYFILQQSFENFTQKVELSPSVCIAVSSIINKFCSLMKNEVDKTEAKNIKEKDIVNLLNIISAVTEVASSSQETKKENE